MSEPKSEVVVMNTGDAEDKSGWTVTTVPLKWEDIPEHEQERWKKALGKMMDENSRNHLVSLPAGTEIRNVAPPDIERRVRVVRIGARDVLDWFALAVAKESPDHVVLPFVELLPEGVKVLAVQHDFATRTFEFLVAHWSFDPVPDGGLTPLHTDPLRQGARVVRVMRERSADVAETGDVIAGLYECETCGRFSRFDPGCGRRCKGCGSDYVRKVRAL